MKVRIKNGDFVEIINNNAYKGISGIVENLNLKDGYFDINTGNSIIVCNTKRTKLKVSTYPIAFKTKSNNYFLRCAEISGDGTPRYKPNPNAEASYSLSTCMQQYTPIYNIEDINNF